MSEQAVLGLEAILPPGTIVINGRCTLRSDGERRCSPPVATSR
jgi:hypothetical protein